METMMKMKMSNPNGRSNREETPERYKTAALLKIKTIEAPKSGCCIRSKTIKTRKKVGTRKVLRLPNDSFVLSVKLLAR